MANCCVLDILLRSVSVSFRYSQSSVKTFITLNSIVLQQDVLMKASRSLIFEWFNSALVALMTGAKSISSLLLVIGVRHNYVFVILYREGKVINYVMCEYEITVC